jgi:hypothetical protein
MATFDPNQSLLPSVGGSITPMSGGGIQEGGRQDAAKGALLLEGSLNEYNESANMRKALYKIAPTYFADKKLEDATARSDVFKEAEKNEAKIEIEALKFLKTVDRKKKVMKIVTDKLGAIESTSQSMIDVLTYINSQTVDDQKIRITLTNDTLVYTMTISAPPEVKEEEKKGSEEPEEEEEESEKEGSEGGKPKEEGESKEEGGSKEVTASSSSNIPLDDATRQQIWWQSVENSKVNIFGMGFKPPPAFLNRIKSIFMDSNIKTLGAMEKAIKDASYTSDDALDKAGKSTKLPASKKNFIIGGWKGIINTLIKKAIAALPK